MARRFGQVTTTSATEVPVEATAYAEPASGAQRSFKSSSGNDTAAGTGARTVKLTYFTLASDGTIAGPFTETVTLNGTAAVATVATNIALIEKIEVLTAGSGGVAAGAISLYTDNAGIGSVIASIAAAAVSTVFAHHYVPDGFQCHPKDLEVLGGDAAGAAFRLKVKKYKISIIEQPLMDGPITRDNTSALSLIANVAPVLGPARVRVTVAPANTNSQVSRASFGYVDERVVFGS